MNKPEIPVHLLVQLRKLLHKHPELSGKEKATAKRIHDFLKSYNPTKIIEGIGGEGIATICQSNNTGPTVLIRCELDGLPIEETNEFEYRSVYKGSSHKCGHDGHMTIVAGLATVLSKHKPASGRVVLLFQPAEENGAGAKAVLVDENFSEIEPDYVFALHNLPGFQENTIVCKPGIFTAAVNSIIIRLQGKTSHAAEPENGINPSLAITEIIQESRKLEIVDEADKGFALITPIQINMGEEAYGISAGYGEMRFTLRTWSNEAMDMLSKKMEKMVIETASKYRLQVTIDWTQSFTANKNNQKMVQLIQNAASANNLEFIEKKEPFKWGEDFGLFTEKYKGAMFGIGAGKQIPALHNPDYDFPDSIIPTGINMFYSVINQLLN